MPQTNPKHQTRPSYRAVVAAIFGALALTGCLSGGSDNGGGNVTSSAGTAGAASGAVQPVVATPAPTSGEIAAPVPQPEAPSAPNVSVGEVITSVSVTDRDNQPLASRIVTFGQPFVRGHVPRGVVATLNGQLLPAQVDVKRRHIDGSVRHAVISVAMPASIAASRAELELRQADAMPSTASGMAPADALAGGFDMVLEVTEGGQIYRASAAALLRAQAARWLDGPLATEFRLAGPLTAGTAPHPVFEALFDVRFFSSTSARVSVVFENALANAARGERTASFRILDQRGQVLFSQGSVYVPAHARFRKVFDWGVQRATRLHVAPRLAYIVATGAAPRYDLTKTLDAQAITDIQALQAGGLNEVFGNGPIQSYMPTTGGRSDIGVLPQWDAVALYTGDPRASDVSIAAGEYAGSFPIHLRNPATRKPYSIDRNPTVSIGWWGNAYSAPADQLPACASACPTKDGLAETDPRRATGSIYGRIHQPDTAHQPSLGFVPYLLSGDPYFLDELQFWAAYDLIVMSPQYRLNGQGLVKDEQTRAQAWSLRTLAQAAWITPDAQAEERAYYEAKVASNLGWYNQNAVNSNPFGFWGEISNVAIDGGRPQAGFASNVRSMVSPWQIDYFIASLDYIAGLGYTDARPFRDWMAKLTIARFGGTHWPRADATAYQMAARWIPPGCGMLATPPSYAGCPSTFPLYDSLAAMHSATFANRDPSQEWWRSPACSMCYEANARVALAAAARAGLPNARAAYDALINDINAAMASLGRDAYLRDPTWLIVP